MGFLVPAWTVEQARYRASWEGLTYVAAHLLNVQIDEERDNAEDTAREAYGTYESVVEEFKELVTSINIEAPLQTFLTENPPLLTLEAARVWPQFKLGDDYITDFVLELGFQEYVLVEIEAPSRKLFTKNGDATADLNHAIQQVEDWLRWIETAASYAQAKLPGIVSPECWVVIGRRIEDPQLAAKWNRKKRTMSTTRIYLFTYDDLLDRAQRQLASLRKMEVS